jgi:GDPmannose 4,6-dehydratase
MGGYAKVGQHKITLVRMVPTIMYKLAKSLSFWTPRIETGLLLKRALITGILGQDGRYLAKYLSSLKYEVHGLTRQLHSPILNELTFSIPDLRVYEIDIRDSTKILDLIQIIKPNEIYNLAGFSSVHRSWIEPDKSRILNELAYINLMNSIKSYLMLNKGREIKVYQASSSEMFGDPDKSPQDENTKFNPISPYGKSKLSAHQAAQEFVKKDGIFVASGILFNHESPFRTSEFISRKISQAVARVSMDFPSDLVIGNIEASRDWGFAGDYVVAMWKMLQLEEPNTFVIATGVSTSIKDLISLSFSKIGISDWQNYVTFDKSELRPNDPKKLVGDPIKAETILNWKAKTSLSGLMDMMIESDRMLLIKKPIF